MIPSCRQVLCCSGSRIKGFTLLELLVAMTLLALLLSAAYGGLRTGSRAWTTGEARAEQNERLRVVQSFIRRQVSQTYPLIWTHQGKRTLWFRGSPTTLDFAAVLASRALDDGLAFLRLEFKEGKKGLDLTLSCKLANGDDLQKAFEVKAPDECRRVRVLVSGLSEGHFDYWGRPTGPSSVNQREPRWTEKWNSRESLPRLIRVSFTADKKQGLWPQMLIPILAQVTPGEEQQTIHAPGAGIGSPDSGDEDDLTSEPEDPD
jgi:general secretion pathway protein J